MGFDFLDQRAQGKGWIAVLNGTQIATGTTREIAVAELLLEIANSLGARASREASDACRKFACRIRRIESGGATGDRIIQAEQNIGTGDETEHIPCSDQKADIFAVYQLGPIDGEAELLADFLSRWDAERFVRSQHRLL